MDKISDYNIPFSTDLKVYRYGYFLMYFKIYKISKASDFIDNYDTLKNHSRINLHSLSLSNSYEDIFNSGYTAVTFKDVREYKLFSSKKIYPIKHESSYTIGSISQFKEKQKW